MSSITLKEKAYLELRKVILNGELKPGDFLTERMLVDMLGMSRTPIRSALERLDVEGLANYTPNKGLVVAEISLNKAVDLYEFRIALECYVVRQLSSCSWSASDKEWFQNNLRLQEQFVRDNDYGGFTEADTLFHKKLTEIHGNLEIFQTMSQLHDKLYQIALSVLKKDRARIGISFEDHVQIYEHIVAGQAALAVDAMEKHLEYGKQILIQ